ncbi:MAG: hypothetical protein ACKVT0_23170 [Planctomycetaceae bacterium]
MFQLLLTRGAIAALLIATGGGGVALMGAGSASPIDAVPLVAALAKQIIQTRPRSRPKRVPRRSRDAKPIVFPPQASVENWGPSCAWAVAAALLKHQGHHEMASWVTRHRSGGADFEEIAADLEAHGYRAIDVYETAELEYWLAKKIPVGIGMPMDGDGRSGHALTLIDLTPTTAQYIDPNAPTQAVTITRHRFDLLWSDTGRSGLVVL